MWDKLKDFTESHYRGVLAVNLAALFFIGTAVFYGVIAVRDISTYDEIIVKADLQPTTGSRRLVFRGRHGRTDCCDGAY